MGQQGRIIKRIDVMTFSTIVCPWIGHKAFVVISEDMMATCRVHIYEDEPHVAVISDLYVDAAARGKGKANEMLSFCETLAKSQNCSEVQLRSDNDDWVRQWYMRKGFEIESTQVWLKKNI